MEKAYFPLFVDISKKRILVVGGGAVAARRVQTLLLFADKITVVAPKLDAVLKELWLQGRIRHTGRKWEEADLLGCDMVLAATDEQKTNQRIGDLCRERKLLVNVADNKEACDFFFPGIVRTTEAVIGISTFGKDPRRAREIREKLEESIGLKKSPPNCI